MSNEFAKIKFISRPDAVTFSAALGHSVHERCVECQAWDEISSVRAMANPDYRECGYGQTVEEARKAAVAAVQEARRKYMLG